MVSKTLVIRIEKKDEKFYQASADSLPDLFDFAETPIEALSLIFDSINTNIALGIEYKNLDQSIKKYMTDHKSPLLLENINKTCIDGNDGTISWIGLMVNDKEQLEYAILDWSIYSGIIGVGYMYLSEYDKNKSPQIKGKINRIYYV